MGLGLKVEFTAAKKRFITALTTPAMVAEWFKTANSRIQVGKVSLRPRFESCSGQIVELLGFLNYHWTVILCHGIAQVVREIGLSKQNVSDELVN